MAGSLENAASDNFPDSSCTAEEDAHVAPQLCCAATLRRVPKARIINCFSVCSSFHCLTAQKPVTLVSILTRGGGVLAHPAAGPELLEVPRTSQFRHRNSSERIMRLFQRLGREGSLAGGSGHVNGPSAVILPRSRLPCASTRPLQDYLGHNPHGDQSRIPKHCSQ